MKLFKKWWHERCVNRNKSGSDGANGGFARVDSIINNASQRQRWPSSSSSDAAATNDNRNGKHADKSGGDALLDAHCSHHHQPGIDSKCCALGSIERFTLEYGVKPTVKKSVSTLSLDDQLILDEYEIVQFEDIVDYRPAFKLDRLFYLGSRVEYGLTLQEVRAVQQQTPLTITSEAKKSKKLKRKARRLKLDVADALNRSLMGPLFQAQKTDSDMCESSYSEVGNTSLDSCESLDVQLHFGLSDSGNIIIDIGHIEEQRGEGTYTKKRSKKFFRKLDCGEEVLESTKFRATWKQWIRKILICLMCKSEGHPRNKTVFSGPGETIGTYALSLADDTESTFSRNISNFISCTKESKAAPQVVMRNMRQFMSGMKNYLVKHGEGEFANEVQKARSQLKSDEFLNLDSILEEVMHRLVILPLREHLYGLFVDYYTQSGDIQVLVEKVKQASGRGPAVFGIKNTVIPPSPSALRQISALFVRLQETELPLEKLDLLLTAVSAIFESTASSIGQQLSADDFLPVLVLVVAHCGFIGAEIEAEYMWGLIQPSLLSGEAGYYLTALCSAVHVLKNFSLHDHDGIPGSMEWVSSTLPECSSVLRVIIPDEYNGSIQTRTLPIRPHTTTKEVCRIIAHKARITNAQDYGLFKLIDGEETLLQDNECPQDVRMAACGKHCMIAYKRVDAKIAWPTVMPTTLTDNQ